MIDDPDRWAPGYAEAGAANVTFHVEAARDPVPTRAGDPRRGRAGRAVGQAGHAARALPGAAARVRHAAGHDGRARLRRPGVHGRGAAQGAAGPGARGAGHLRLFVEVDGGIAEDTIEAAAEAGADVFVAGHRGLRRRRPGARRSRCFAARPALPWLAALRVANDAGTRKQVQVSEAERAAMHRALALAETVRGRTSPNPPVGAVILDATGALAGEGATQAAGGPHAEVVALAAAGPRRSGRNGRRHAGAVRPHRPDGAVHRRARRRRRRAGRLRGRRPQPSGSRRRRQADRGRRRGRRRPRSRPSCRRRAPPVAARAADRAPVRDLEVRHHRSTAGSPPPTGRPAGSPRRCLAPTLTRFGPSSTRSSSAVAPCWPTIRR